MASEGRKPTSLEESEIEIVVPKGAAKHVRVVEGDQVADITVRVSKLRKSGARPILGVIVK